MNILLTNDDGIHAEGINSLYKVLSKEHNICIIAPDAERSGCSNSFSLNKNLKVIKIFDNKYATSGFPADCVSLGLYSDLCFDPDLVLSGINHGSNLAIDQFYSGTIAGARTAYINGKSGIAISMDSCHKVSPYFDDVSIFILKFIEKNKSDIYEGKCFFSINYPNIPKEKLKGKKFTFLGRKIYKDRYNIIDSNNEIIFEKEGGIQYFDLPGSDINELNNNFISITPLTIECTDFTYLNKIKFLAKN